MERSICVERRTANATQTWYNKAGDWRPRLIVWPEYNGWYKKEFEKQKGSPMDEPEASAWANVIAEAIRDFGRKHDLSKTVFRRVRAEGLMARLSRAFSGAAQEWVEESAGPHRLTPDYALARERGQVKDEVVYLLSEAPARALDLRAILDTRVMDRATLLPYGQAIVELGTDEPVAELSFADERQESLFVEVLETAAQRYEHRLERVTKHFLTWWVVANRRLGQVPPEEEF